MLGRAGGGGGGVGGGGSVGERKGGWGEAYRDHLEQTIASCST